jgi:hypothetical protein
MPDDSKWVESIPAHAMPGKANTPVEPDDTFSGERNPS